MLKPRCSALVSRKLLITSLIALMLLSLFDPPVSASEDINGMVLVYIRPDGSIETNPPGIPANISSMGDYYLLTGDIHGTLIVEKSGIWIDGGGHALRGPGDTTPGLTGLRMINVSGVYVSNLVITGFSTGIYLYLAGQNHFYNIVVKGVFVNGAEIIFSDGNIFTYCYFIGANTGIYIKSSRDNVFYRNAFIDNGVHVAFWGVIYPNVWDDGSQGNYWSGHTCVDQNEDGVCENEYLIATGNVDRHPLAKPPVLPQESPGTTTTTELTSPIPTATTTQTQPTTSEPPAWTTLNTFTPMTTTQTTQETTHPSQVNTTWVATTTFSTSTHSAGGETTYSTQPSWGYTTSQMGSTTPFQTVSLSSGLSPQDLPTSESGGIDLMSLAILVVLLLFGLAISLVSLKIRGKREG